MKLNTSELAALRETLDLEAERAREEAERARFADPVRRYALQRRAEILSGAARCAVQIRERRDAVRGRDYTPPPERSPNGRFVAVAWFEVTAADGWPVSPMYATSGDAEDALEALRDLVPEKLEVRGQVRYFSPDSGVDRLAIEELRRRIRRPGQ
jgi:hypothetical protein